MILSFVQKIRYLFYEMIKTDNQFEHKHSIRYLTEKYETNNLLLHQLKSEHVFLPRLYNGNIMEVVGGFFGGAT